MEASLRIDTESGQDAISQETISDSFNSLITEVRLESNSYNHSDSTADITESHIGDDAAEPVLTRSGRIRRANTLMPTEDCELTTPRRRVVHITTTKRTHGLHMSVRQSITEMGDMAKESMEKEVSQLLQRNSWHGVALDAQRKKIILSHMFIKPKYKASRELIKVKSRLVAGGHKQDVTIFKNQSSTPTAATASVFLIASIAHYEKRSVATVDFPGAYLNARMPKDKTDEVDKKVSEIVIKLDNSYERYLNSDGTIIVKLDGALYGLKQSGRLWYEALSSKLREIGYLNNPYDKCVFNRLERDGSQSTLVLHVDVILISAKGEERIDLIIKDLDKFYGKVEVHRGRKLEYLGIVFDYSNDDYLEIFMDKCMEDVVKDADVAGTVNTPATEDLFKLDKDSAPLSNEERERFHSSLSGKESKDGLTACCGVSHHLSTEAN